VHDGAMIRAQTHPVRRLRHRPIVEAGAVPDYGPLFNAGVLRHGGRYHLFARAVREGYRLGDGTGPRFVDYVSDIVVFTSVDGHHDEYGYVLAHADTGGTYCSENPRVQWVEHRGSRQLVMTYTYLPPPGAGPWRIGGHHLRWDGERFELDESTGRLVGPPDVANKDAVVFTLADGRVTLIHRIHPDMRLALFDDLDHLWNATADCWEAYLADLASQTLLAPSPGALGIGAAARPVRTAAGFLLFLHERRADGSYTMNVALLDESTGRVLTRLAEPVLERELAWERAGDVKDVVFVQDAHLDGDDIYLTYGAADRLRRRGRCVGRSSSRRARCPWGA